MTKKMLLMGLCALLAGCGTRTITPPPLPTVIPLEAAATALVLTQNAPPDGYEVVSFPRIDGGLPLLPGWRYEVALSFEGVFARTSRPVSTSTQAEVTFNQVASARRVLALINNDIVNDADPLQFEAVRLGPDAFLVRDGVCLSNAGEDAALAADLSAGALLGGVQQASSAAQQAIINGQQVWRYAFTPQDVAFGSIRLRDDSRITALAGELWVSPTHNAVVRYYLSAELENVLLFDVALPVSGSLRLRYDLYDVGSTPNLSVPFGC